MWRKITDEASKVMGNKSLMIFLAIVGVLLVISWLG
jgi:hypothetical protein